jgi:hypothetical protein
MRRIFGIKRNEIIRGWRKLHNEELHNVYSSPNTFRMSNEDEMVGHVTYMREESI